MVAETYLINAVREGRFRVLKKFVPPTLFIETNLPPIKVYYSLAEPRMRTGEACVSSKKSRGVGFASENPQLALSLYLPGRPLYRLDPSHGSFIPFWCVLKDKDADVCKHITCIDEYYHLEDDSSLAGKRHIIIKYLPEELIRFLEEHGLLKHKENIKVSLVDSIHTEVFHCLLECRECYEGPPIGSRRGPCYHWYYAPRKSTNFLIQKDFQRRSFAILDVVKPKSTSYGRFVSVVVNINRDRELVSLLKTVLNPLSSGMLRMDADVGQADVLRLLYALDYRVLTWRLKNVPPLHSVNPDCFKRVRGGLYEGVKVLVTCRKSVNPVVLGYKVRDSYFVEIKVESSSLCKSLDSERTPSEAKQQTHDLGQLYRRLAVNTVLFNYVTFIALSDLMVLSILRRIGSPNLLLKTSIAYHDLYGKDPLAKLIREACCTDIVFRLVSIVLDYLKGSNPNQPDPRAVLAEYVIGGKHKSTLYNAKTVANELDRARDAVVRYLARALCNVDLGRDNYSSCTDLEKGTAWCENALKYVLTHVISHHLISRIGTKSRVPLAYLAEYHEPNKDFTVIVETLSGGLKAIETATELWNREKDNDPISTVNDLILSLGSCIVGSAEDILYYVMLRELVQNRKTDLGEVRKAIGDVCSLLGVVYTPVELREAEKLFDAVVDEASKLVALTSKRKPVDLIYEVVKSRYECELKLQRSCSSDELVLYIISNLSNLPVLKEIVKTMLLKIVERREMVRRELVEVYKHAGSCVQSNSKLVECFIHDVVALSSGSVSNMLASAIVSSRKKVGRLIILLSTLIRSVVMKLALKGCDDACGYCYVSQYSCRHTAPWIQKLTLSRRLAKLYATHIVMNKLATSDFPGFDALLGKIRVSGNTMYLKTPYSTRSG